MAQSQADSGWIYQCDDIVVEPRAHRLERAGAPIAVEPKAYVVLTTLLQQAGHVVSKDDLLDAAWGHRHVTPGVLSRAISQLRRALGDCVADPQYIATVHSLGYRFIGEVRRIPIPAAPIEAPNGHAVGESPAGIEIREVPATPAPNFKRKPRFSRMLARWLPAAITLAIIAAMLAAMSMGFPPHDHLSLPSTGPRPALVVMPYAHASDPRFLHPRHWPRYHRTATGYLSPRGDEPSQALAPGYLTLRPEQAPAAQD
ncbi:winged helix-turn-helix domain-containing protein [Dyella halodurans]|uniref:Transcriptional regulator n=1 Tax=Dyella halodurans TaxID=1920171 RepID=A0ABV9BYD5_9GAMM|nr:winged helix-turn-helix domain-containing protein [Dyella halodurans]